MGNEGGGFTLFRVSLLAESMDSFNFLSPIFRTFERFFLVFISGQSDF